MGRYVIKKCQGCKADDQLHPTKRSQPSPGSEQQCVWSGVVMEKQDLIFQHATLFVLDCSSEVFQRFTYYAFMVFPVKQSTFVVPICYLFQFMYV